MKYDLWIPQWGISEEQDQLNTGDKILPNKVKTES